MRLKKTRIPGAGLLTLSVIWGCGKGFAQEMPQPAAVPLQTTLPAAAIKSPEFGPDDSVTFRLSAPQANTVSVNGDWLQPGVRPLAMTKGDDGIWRLTVSGLKPELRTYTFMVDGVGMLDPGNADILRNGRRELSGLMVPGEGTALLAVTDVAHGDVHQVWYGSPTLGMKQRRMYVYTPSGYKSGSQRYPVLYLLHGGGGDEDAWSSMGRAIEILDNLIAAGKAVPMIVAMPNGSWNQTASPGITEQAVQVIPNAASPAGATGLGIAQMKGAPSIVADIVPFVDKNFRTMPGRDHRAIAGLSMGGAQSALVGLNHLDKFSYVAMFSAGLPLLPGALKVVPVPAETQLRGAGIGQELNLTAIANDFPQLNASSNAKLHLLYISCGETDGLITSNLEFMDWLTSKSVAFKKMLLPGYVHEWPFWRISLIDLVPQLFRLDSGAMQHHGIDVR